MKAEQLESCPLCQKNASKKYSGHMGYQMPEQFDIFHCDHCVTAYCHPLKVEGKIYDHIYSQISDVPGYDRYLHFADKVLWKKDPLAYLSKSEDVYWAIEQYLLEKKNKRLKILEVGSGFGYLTYALSKRGYDVRGLEISQVAVEQATRRYGDLYICGDVFEYCKQHPQEFDVVIFTEVIEHIPHVLPFMDAIRALLAPNGEMVLTTPNKSAYPPDVLWETEPPPVHLWWFSEDSIKYLASCLGYQVKYIDFSEYNKKSLSRTNIKIRNFMPTRLPRLDSNGKVCKHGNFIQKKGWKNRCRIAIKKFIRGMGLLGAAKEARSLLFRVKQQFHSNLGKPINSRRAVLCAILSKSSLHEKR